MLREFKRRGRRVREGSPTHAPSPRAQAPRRQPRESTRELNRHEIEMLARVFAFRDANEIVEFANRLEQQANVDVSHPIAQSP